LTTGSKVSSGITAFIALGFVAFSFGVGLLAWQELDRLNADMNLRLVAMGGMIMLLGILAAKLFSRIE
jgi:hypothetical protein